jgi:hypothetical protein
VSDAIITDPIEQLPTPLGIALAPTWSSLEIDKLATALAKAQGEIGDAELDSTNPHFRSDYATLTSCWHAVREPLSKHSLAIAQLTRLEGDTVLLDTVLMHSSGQWVRSTYPVKPDKPTAQGYGSALSYAKRYSLCSVCGIAPAGEDDDGNAASPAPLRAAPRAAPQQPATPNKPITDPQRKKMWAMAKQREETTGTDARQIIDAILGDLNITEKRDDGKPLIRMGEFDAIVRGLEKWEPKT